LIVRPQDNLHKVNTIRPTIMIGEHRVSWQVLDVEKSSPQKTGRA
jgi:hypothetical protein